MIDISTLTIPAIAAPMTGVSTPELVIAACNAGIIGAFPSSNCESVAELGDWLDRIEKARRPLAGPVAVNLIVRNRRIDADLACVIAHSVPIVITSVGDPTPTLAPLQSAGVEVYVDVASLRHARRAVDAGADGLVLLSAGAGGHTGWANPFAFARAVRTFFDGPLVLAGGVSDGVALWAAVTLGYDLGYLGTKLIATLESGAGASWRDAVVRSTLDDVELTVAPNGLAANLLRPNGNPSGSAGHTVSGVNHLMSVAEVVSLTEGEWVSARARTLERLVT